MNRLEGNQVKTRFSDYAFKTREEAEAFYFVARERQGARPLACKGAARPAETGAPARRSRP